MTRRPAGFYDDFEVFLKEVTREMNKRNMVSFNWLQGINIVMGAGTLSHIMSDSLKADLPFEKYGTNTLTTGYAIRSTLDKVLRKFKGKKSNFSAEQESERIEKARLLFYEYFITLDDAIKKEKLNELFEDLVTGEEILY